MGIFVKISKILEKDAIGYYRVYALDEHDVDFYMGIDKKNRSLMFYLDENLINPIKTINFETDEEIGSIPNVSMISYSRAIIKGFKAFDMKDFPDILDYAA